MLTITEALAEIKTIGKRIEKKRSFVTSYLTSQEGIKDPLSKMGGSIEAIKQERQAIADLETRIVGLRTRIQQSNLYSQMKVNAVEKSVAEWLTWRKEVAQSSKKFLDDLRITILTTRKQAQKLGNVVVAPGAAASNPTDVIINVDEGELAKESEVIEEILGTLDGQLSLHNATTHISV